MTVLLVVNSSEYSDAATSGLRNARTWKPHTGFYDGASRRMLDMLLFRDVFTP
jgi:hypothetical protein